ncbi:MAG TPA: branched-chain amino acid ABC transporter substrate-binding protein [Casimicrobiaceae bacterium]|nr:branched-chain amino acid ABC transporter substrate-binding protein [Casimicrobiaceae bacterium]
MSGRARRMVALGFAIGCLAASASADIKIAFIDPLSGGGAATGILAQKTHQFYIDGINAAGGLNGEKLVLLSYDNKVNPQESLIQLKRALDEGARYVVQGNGSGVALALTDAVQKYNERNPGKEVVYLNYAAVDPALTNEKCNFWHFRFDADADMKMAALTDVIARDTRIKRVYLINQDYSFGKAVAAAATKMLAEKRPDIKIVGDELHPLQKVNDFSPYVAKIKAAGADTVITGNWSNDMVLLIKAGKDAGMKVDWETYYGGSPGAVTAIGEAGVDTLKQVSEWHRNATPELDASVLAFSARYPGAENEYSYWRAKTMWEMFAAAARKAQSNEPVKVARAMEGMKMPTALGEVEMRADNHQLLQPLYVSTLSRNAKYDSEGTGLGWKTDAKVEAKATALPTTCKMDRPK